MANMTLQRDFDAIVVGSGATGGIAAWALTAKGLSVAVLEAGPDRARIYGSTPGRIARLARACIARDQPVQRRHIVYWMTDCRLFVSDRDNPYVTPAEAPFAWIRGRQVGGRTHLWGGLCLRFSDREFAGPDAQWPLRHRDLDAYYGRIERLLDVHGSRDGLAQLPDGEFADASPMSPGELHLKARLAQHFGRHVIAARGIRAPRAGTNGSAGRLSSNATSLAAARATGRMALRSDTLVTRIAVDAASGRATGVECIDARTLAPYALRAPLVVLCASAFESVRVMLNSRSAPHPGGIGAARGLLGRGIMDHVASPLLFQLPHVPEAAGLQLLGSDGVVIPRYEGADATVRGYGYWGGVSRYPLPRWLRRDRAAALGVLYGMGEAARDDGNRIALDAARTDKWGVPCAAIRYAWTDDDVRLARRMREDAASMIEACGGRVVGVADALRIPFLRNRDADAMDTPGLFVHEVGGARMGDDPATSVADAFSRVWDCPNLVLGDGATFVTSGWQNPTLTEMALCLRACEHAADRLAANAL